MGSINSGEKKGLNVITKDFMNKTQTKLRTKLSCVYKYDMYKVTVCSQLCTNPYITHCAS